MRLPDIKQIADMIIYFYFSPKKFALANGSRQAR